MRLSYVNVSSRQTFAKTFTPMPGCSKHDQILISVLNLFHAFFSSDTESPNFPLSTPLFQIKLIKVWDQGLPDDNEASVNRIGITAHAGKHIPIF